MSAMEYTMEYIAEEMEKLSASGDHEAAHGAGDRMLLATVGLLATGSVYEGEATRIIAAWKAAAKEWWWA